MVYPQTMNTRLKLISMALKSQPHGYIEHHGVITLRTTLADKSLSKTMLKCQTCSNNKQNDLFFYYDQFAGGKLCLKVAH